MSNPTPSAPVQQGGMEITAEERVSEENPSQCDIPPCVLRDLELCPCGGPNNWH